MASMRKPGKLVMVSEHYATDRSTSATLVTTAAASDRDKVVVLLSPQIAIRTIVRLLHIGTS
jgi:hypothetical protein